MASLPASGLHSLALGGQENQVARVRALLGIPYAEDAGLDEQGRWARFTQPNQLLERPGLNCSGFLVAAARRLLGFTGTLAAAGRDRLGDSGPGAQGGLDWD